MKLITLRDSEARSLEKIEEKMLNKLKETHAL